MNTKNWSAKALSEKDWKWISKLTNPDKYGLTKHSIEDFRDWIREEYEL